MDRFERGFIIGVVASGIKDILSWLDYSILHFTKATYAHLMGVILFGRVVNTTSELIYSQLVEIGFEGFIGILFIYFVYRTENKRNFWFKGILFANGVYIFTSAINTFFRLPTLNLMTLETSISTAITSTIFGVFMGLGVYWWGIRIGDFESEQTERKKSMRFNLP